MPECRGTSSCNRADKSLSEREEEGAEERGAECEWCCEAGAGSGDEADDWRMRGEVCGVVDCPAVGTVIGVGAWNDADLNKVGLGMRA